MAQRAIKERRREKTYRSTPHLLFGGLYLHLIPKQDHQLPPDSGFHPNPFRICLAHPDQPPPCLLDQSKLPLPRSGPHPLATSALSSEKSEWNLRGKTLRRSPQKLSMSHHLRAGHL